jgi:membrane associated rhomboid family serine protease/Flp pilus assembly protein TadD
MIIIPIGDDNPVERQPYVNLAIIATNVVIFLVLAHRSDYLAYIKAYALVPERFRPYTFVTYMFFHGSLGHLFWNMLFLAIVGKNVEDRLGHVMYAVLYFLAGFVACNLHIVIATQTGHGDIPMIGASGAIAGIMAAYAAFFPRNQIRFLFLFFWPFFVASAWAIGFWFAIQLAVSFLSYRVDAVTGVAYWAHVGGFGFGFVVALMYNQWVPRDELERSIALFFARGSPNRAIDRYEQFRKKYTWRALSPILQQEVAEAYENRQDVPQAIEAYQLFLKAYPDDSRVPETEAKLASIHFAPPQPTSAKKSAETAAESAGDPPVLDPAERALALGRHHFKEKNWDDAIERFREAIGIEPRSVGAHAYLGVAFYEKGQYKDAIEATQEAIDLGGATPVVYNNLARAYLANGQREEAADAWRQALSLDPKNRTARDGLKQLSSSKDP